MAPPPAPNPSNAEVVRLGPKLSSAQPTGTCIIANAKNQYPEAAESWAEVGTVTSIMAIAMFTGNFFYGPLDRIFGTRKWVIFYGNSAGAVFCILLYTIGGSGFWTTMTLMAGIGFFGASFPILMAHGRSFFPDHLMGRGVTLINLFGIGGVGLMQNLSARIYDATTTETTTVIAPYNAVIMLFCISILIGLIIYFFSQDRTD